MKVRIHIDEIVRQGRVAAAAMVRGVPENEHGRALAQAEAFVLPTLEGLTGDANGFVDAEHVVILARTLSAQSEALHAAAYVAFSHSKEGN